jgi:transcriptional regulator with GAF, ATPase, and Fis domain
MAQRRSRESRLTDAFVDLAQSLVTGYDVVDLLHSLIDHCLDLVEVSAAGLVLRDPSGALEVLASSGEDTRLLELLQLRQGSGPCIECYLTGRVVTVDDLAIETNSWPRFREQALEQGVRSVHAVPMRLGTETIGAMNLFGGRPGALSRADGRVVQALADVATIAILQERALSQSRVVREQLQGALNSRVVIEQAKGVLAQQGHLDMDTAFTLMRSYARGRNERLSEVAAAVVAGRLDARSLSRTGEVT